MVSNFSRSSINLYNSKTFLAPFVAPGRSYLPPQQSGQQQPSNQYSPSNQSPPSNQYGPPPSQGGSSGGSFGGGFAGSRPSQSYGTPSQGNFLL